MSGHPCGRYRRLISRRQALQEVANGFGAVALSAMLGRQLPARSTSAKSLPVKHFPARAQNVIFLYMDGGPSQVDTFDPKPMLDRFHGQDPRKVIGELLPTQFDSVGTVLKSPWKFKQYGESGIWVSDLFPHLAGVVDELAVIRSMTSEFSTHTNANYFLHTGSGLQGRPSMGAWSEYGLGSENDNLPGFVVLNGGLIPPGGLDNFNSGFLPASYQGSVFQAADVPLANIAPTETVPGTQRSKLELMYTLDALGLQQHGRDDAIESAIANYELAARMQLAVPELMDISTETDATRRLYGLDDAFANTRTFGRQCLVARRLVERGVRFVELTGPAGNGDRWDQHSNLVDGHNKNAKTVDLPIAGLIQDLKSRGLLDQTLIVWGGEFGRTPFAQGSNGRDHNPTAFSVWMCGGGIKGGVTYGTTDEWGYRVIENRAEIHDLHATILHLLGIDHERLTFRYGGRDMRLTDVHGNVLHDVIA